VTYSTLQAREGLLKTLTQAIEEIALAVNALGEAYEQLDEYTGDQLEEQLFRPAQLAYGKLKQTYTSFAERFELSAESFSERPAGPLSSGVKGFLDSAMQATATADEILSSLQDSLLPVEVGDPQLRAGIASVRELLGDLPGRARQLTRTFGR
jgi:hypothetical protein